ncbi:hypothetical protein DES53_102585 [Roseimicrobium gellanilyticum]|uniref:Uncharacterized protein n=1 Tax=Roseimicrobium gellanilyticum TaxID=748857 RepID=A0A366HSF8_9BACT|nr:hypothetical protein [Roseimicrobium gellanilyticum]RBP46199.1 hypothetical protein DES53_102585 [Roseimicrobium gellanilyticum]
MSLTTNTQSFLFLMGSLNDATVLDAAIESQHLEFQKLGVLTYLGRLEESPDEFCNRLTEESGVDCEIHWMRLPYPSERPSQPPAMELPEEPVELEAPACFIVNH